MSIFLKIFRKYTLILENLIKSKTKTETITQNSSSSKMDIHRLWIPTMYYNCYGTMKILNKAINFYRIVTEILKC